MAKSYRAILPLIFLFLFLAVNPEPTLARPVKHLFKIASLAPEGSVWARRFNDFVEEVEARSNGEISFKVYTGGVMGDDRSVYRKMRIGQLQGGGFTMTGIGEVVQDFRILGIPFLFESYGEVDRVKEEILPLLDKAFAEKDLILLAMTEVGFIYTMSTRPIASIAELRKTKSWAPEGDPVSQEFLKTIGISATPLSIPDVLTSLQTGLIDTVYNSFYGSIVLQWFTRTRYIADIPFGYAYGGLVLDRKKFSAMPKEYMDMVKDVAVKHFARLLDDTRQSNADSLKVLQDNGMQMVKTLPEEKVKLQQFRDKSLEDLIGKAFSREIYTSVMKVLELSRLDINKLARRLAD